MFVVGLLAQQVIKAQGIVYLSNLGQTPTGSNPVGSNSWLAADFITGANAGGYTLNSVQLALADATGNPGGFTVMVYAKSGNPAAVLPGSSLETLTGSFNPSTAGTYTYTDVSNLILSPSTDYFIVLTAGTAVASGAYEWSYTSIHSYNPSDGWSGVAVTIASSNNGSSWTRLGTNPNFDYSGISITATPVPEPSSSFLLLLGSGVFLCVRRAFRR